MKAIELVEDGLLSVRDACKWLGVSRSTLYQLMESGELPYTMVAKSKRAIPKAALKIYAAKKMRGRLFGQELDREEGQANDVA